jgi:hypothetical protein
MIPFFAELPSWLPLFAGLSIAAAIVVVFGMILLMRGFREFSAGITSMVQSELAKKHEPAPVAVQQPLVVKPHDGLVSISQHEELRDQFSALTDQRRKDVAGLHIKIEQGLENVRRDIAGEFKELRETQVQAREEIAVLKNETGSQTRQLHALDSKLEDLPDKIFRLMERRKS